MIQLILLIVGIVYACRKPKLRALTAETFPAMPREKFDEWRTLEMQSINIFLWATWGVFFIGTPLVFILAAGIPGSAVGLQILYFLVFVLLLAFSAIPGSKAAKLKKEYAVSWPK